MGFDWIRNPLIVKEFKERFRTRKAPFILAGYLSVIGLIFLGFIYIQSVDQPNAVMDVRFIFIVLSIVQLVLVSAISPTLTASAISGERERQTLNILLTTLLPAKSIIWGKLLTGLAFTLLILVSSMPLYGLMFLYGGVQLSEIIQAFLFQVFNMLLFGTIGLFCSAWLKKTTVSTVVAYVISLVIGAGTALMALFWYRAMEVNGIGSGSLLWQGIPFFLSLNPVFTLVELFVPGAIPRGGHNIIAPWLIYLVVYALVALAFFLWSVYLLHPERKAKQGAR
jgi:ABC-type transport system involved in multi-copper enzyme maturation permease subunit